MSNAARNDLHPAVLGTIADYAVALVTALGPDTVFSLTGGMAHSERVVNRLIEQIGWIAPITVYPGEDELRALAEGVFRVLDGEEEARRMRAEV